MQKIIKVFVLYALFVLPVTAQVTSALWGVEGNAWDTNGILRDFTHVGYKGSGAEQIPGTNDWPNAVDVTDPQFGAIPNDGIDDTDAFIAAISNCPDYSAVFVPNGRYIITKRIQPENDHFVLRGEDMYETVLFFPKYLSEVYIEQFGFDETGELRNSVREGAFLEMVGGEEKSIENLTLEFREQRKGGMWEYIGANLVLFDNITNSWIQNVRIKNFDVGIKVRADYISVINIVADHYNGRSGVGSSLGSYLSAFSAILPRTSSHVLYHNIDIKEKLLQPVDSNDNSHHSVYSKISVNEMNSRVVGLHGGTAKFHLYTEFNNRVNRDTPGIHGDSWSDSTYWGLDQEVETNAYLEATNRIICVGFGDDWPKKDTGTFWYEPAAYDQLTPLNLYLAQLDYFNKPLPEDFPTPLPAPYEMSGDVIRMPASDDITPGADPTDPLDTSGAYLKFNMAAASEPAVEHARLRLTLTGIGSSTPYKLSAWMVADDSWSEDTLTVSNQPVVLSELDSVWILDGEPNLTVEFDVTEFVRDQLVGGDEVLSFYVNRPEGEGSSTDCWSSEMGPHPELIIERTASSVPDAPSAPKGIGSTALVGNIVLDWDDNPESDVASYTVYRTPCQYGLLPIGGGLITSDYVDVSSEESWSVGMMDYRQVYHYWITAVDDHGYESPRSREFVAAVTHPYNDPPAFSTTVSLATATAREGYSDNLADEASDPESDPMYFMKVSGPDWLNVDLDGTLTGTPDLGDVGSNQFVFQVTAIGGSTQKVVSITVNLPTDNPSGAPAVPENFNPSVDDSSVSLSWTSNTEADLYGYNIYRSTSSDSLGNLLSTLVGTNATVDSTANNGTTYWYTLKAVDTSDNESGGAQTSATPSDPDPAPAAPANLSATGGDYFVDLNWNANSEGDLAGYTIYRSNLAGTYYGDPIATNVTDNSYRDNTVLNSNTYYYVVTAVDANGNESPVSNEDSALPADIAPEPPTGLFVMARDGEVYLYWNESADVDFSSYSVYRSTTSGSYGSALETSLTSNSYLDTSAVNGTTYYYTVKAVDAGAQESGPGNEESATPQAGLQTTVFIGNGVSGEPDNYISTAANWDAGLPVSGKQGLLNMDAGYDSNVSHDGYDVVHKAGLLSKENGFSGLALGSSLWITDGPTAAFSNTRGISLNGGQFTLNEGNADLSNSDKDTKVEGSGGSITINGGTMLIGDDLFVSSAGTFTVNDGTVTGINEIRLEDGFFVLNGGSMTADTFVSGSSYTNTFGGTTEGSLTLLTGLGTAPTLNWLPGTKMSMTVASSNEWAEVEWDADRLTYNGQSKTALGKTWAQVAAADGLESGINFEYDSGTETLSLYSSAEEDTTAPAAPTGLAATAGDGQISLVWDANAENDLSSYSVYRSTTSSNYSSAPVTGLNTTNYIDSNVTNGITYYYAIAAVDISSNESAKSTEDSAIPTDSTPPAVPTGLNGSVGDGTVSLTWNANGEEDFSSYTLYRSTSSGSYGSVLTNGLTSPSYEDTAVVNDTTYYYSLRAADTNGNVSGYSEKFSATPYAPDTTAPAMPAGLVAMAGDGQVSLVWDANGETDLSSYSVYRSTTSSNYPVDALTNSLTSTNFVDTGVINGTTYYYAIEAVDTSNNVSDKSAEDSATPVDAPPAAPTGLAATAGDGSVSLDWDDNAEGDLDSYNVFRSTTSSNYPGAALVTVSSSAYVDDTAQNGTTYYYAVSATDTNSNESVKSVEDSATPVDAPPAAPTGLAATAGDGSVSLDWNDNGESDLTGYSVYRSTTQGSGYSEITNSLSSSETVDSNVTNGTTYYYVVRAVDTGSNESPDSNEESATPSAPEAAQLTLTELNSGDLSDNSANPYHLSEWGQKDWKMWKDSLTIPEEKMAGGSGISALSYTPGAGGGVIGNILSGRAPYYSWTNGTPTATVTASQKKRALGSAKTASTGDRISFTVDASTGQSTLYLLAGVLEGAVTITASLPGAVDQTSEYVNLGNNGNFVLYKVDYTAGSESDVLTITLDKTQADSDGFIFIQSAAVSASAPVLTGYDLWAAEWNTDIGSATNDLDADGFSNFGEYALGGNPTNSAVIGSLPVFSKSGSGFICVHPIRSDDTSLSYWVETTTNLINGVWTNQGVIAVGTNVTGGTLDFVTNDVGSVEKDKFIRLKVEQ